MSNPLARVTGTSEDVTLVMPFCGKNDKLISCLSKRHYESSL